MNYKKYCFACFLIFFLWMAFPDLFPTAETIVFEEEGNSGFVCLPAAFNRRQGQYLGVPREYSRAVTQKEEEDIRYIVTSLANESLLYIATMRDKLEQAGDRIDHVHPLRFLMTVFTDEQMKVGIRRIRGRGWIWGTFAGGLKDSLSNESRIHNMKDEFVKDFAHIVKIDLNAVSPMIKRQDWDQLINFLIQDIPRQGNHGRYDA